MQRTLSVMVVGVMLLALPLMAQDRDQLVEDGLSIFLHDQVVVENRAELERAIESLEIAVQLDPADAEVLNALSQCYYTLADVYEAEDEAKKTAYTEGWQYGEMSLRLAPGFDETEEKLSTGKEVCDD